MLVFSTVLSIKMKIAYNKYSAAKVFAYEDPKVPNRFVLPANSTDVEPPDFDSTTHTCVYEGEKWVLTAIPEPVLPSEKELYIKTYVDKRREEYGPFEDQLEYITEYGLEAWQQKVAEIKSKYPKDL